MKKLALFLSLILLLVFTGCSQNSSGKSSEASGFEGDTQEKAGTNYPEKPIEMILPFPTGSNYDGAARILMKYAEKYLPNNQSIALLNKTGGNNTAGVTELANAKPDGYTLGFVQTSTITTEPHRGHVPYSHDSFQPILKVLQVDGYMFVSEDSPWGTFDEWLDYVKENPGEFSVSVVPGAVPVLETMKVKMDIDFNIVPFDGFAEATTALLGGHVDGTIATEAGMKANMDAGKVRMLFSTTGREIDNGITTLKEEGFDIEENKMVGVFAPKDLPKDLLNLLHDAFKQALDDPKLHEEFEKAGIEAVYAGPEEFQQEIEITSTFDRDMMEISGLIGE